jgi:hypothetical protein
MLAQPLHPPEPTLSQLDTPRGTGSLQARLARRAAADPAHELTLRCPVPQTHQYGIEVVQTRRPPDWRRAPSAAKTSTKALSTGASLQGGMEVVQTASTRSTGSTGSSLLNSMCDHPSAGAA